ncbi:MAG: hypothetical protein AAF494_05310 [Pseudomonadota bacterium]
MFDIRWKSLIVSILAYQLLLTWCLFDLVDTAAYLARTECGARCANEWFGFILTNQGGHNTAMTFLFWSAIIAFINALIWLKLGRDKHPGSSADNA